MKNYEYGLIGNCTSAALVSKDCSIDWLCMPFFDSPSLFAKLLDEGKGGFFRIAGVDTVNITQKYIPYTAILKTVVETKDGTFAIYDYMPRFLTSRSDYHCPSEIHRNIHVLSGRPKIRVEFVPRPNYALGDGECRITPDYIKVVSQKDKGPYNSFYLYTNLDFDAVLNCQEIELPEYAYFLLSYHEKLERINIDKIFIEYQKTKTYWFDWSQRTAYPEGYKDLVLRSAITLKLLMFHKTGAVIAAPTTSLPEIIGRDRNWDYRYCWVRDASMIIDLYSRIGHVNEVTRFINFILNRMLLKHNEMAVMYGINGEVDLVEEDLDHLAGYENSKPVRIGNGAYTQKQNDLYGEMIEMVYTYFVVNKRNADQFNEETWTMVRSLANHVAKIWHTPDSGIWERREAFQHYVHSKLMSWVAMDRAVKIAKHIGKYNHVERWSRVAEEIKQDILKNGWNEKMQSFSMYYGSDIYDASNLLMFHYGFLDRKDPRMVSMVQQTYKHLVQDGFTFRYIDEDEFGKPENAFIVCTFWMINALYLIGEERKARDMFENILKCGNHLGLYSEDVVIASKRLIGNFPQGYSHLALIQTVLLLETDYNWSDAYSMKFHNSMQNFQP